MSEPERFFIGTDESGHDYVVPVRCRDEWEAWVQELPPSGIEPVYAMRVEGEFTFTDPRILYR